MAHTFSEIETGEPKEENGTRYKNRNRMCGMHCACVYAQTKKKKKKFSFILTICNSVTEYIYIYENECVGMGLGVRCVGCGVWVVFV